MSYLRITTMATVALVATLAGTVTTASSLPLEARGQEVGATVDRIAAFVHDAEAHTIETAITTTLEAVRVYLANIETRRAEAAAVAARPVTVGAGAGGGGGGSCYGGPVPDYIVTRESGGNPNAVNPSSGAYGCFQIMPANWAGPCAGIARDVAGQKRCAQVLIDRSGGTLAPWATG